MRWRSHPLARGGWRRLLVFLILVVAPLGLGILYGPFYALLALVILSVSLGTYFLPTVYVLYVGGLETRFLGSVRRFTWEQFRSFYPDRNGVLLSPFPGPSRLENFRGVFLRCAENRDEVLSVIRERIRIEPPAQGEAP